MYFTAQQRHETEHPYAAETAAAEGQRVKMARWRNFVAVGENSTLKNGYIFRFLKCHHWLGFRCNLAQPSAAGSCGAKAKCDRLPMQPCAAICGGVVRRQRKAKTIFSGGDCFTNKIIALRRRTRTRDLAASSSLKLRRPLTMTARLWAGRRGNLDLLRSR